MKIDNLLETTFLEPPQRIFRDVEHYGLVRSAILSALGGKNKAPSLSGNSYLIDRLVINFTTKVETEEIYIDYLNSRIILDAPIIINESRPNQDRRRLEYLSILVKSVEAIVTTGVSHIYLALCDEGREKLGGPIAMPLEAKK